MKTEIEENLGKSWNGIAVNGTPFTQWFATDSFFDKWKKEKEQIKSAGFNLFKDKNMGWVVTLFGFSNGEYSSYDEYNKESKYSSAMSLLDNLEDVALDSEGTIRSHKDTDGLIRAINSIRDMANKDDAVIAANHLIDFEWSGGVESLINY